MFAKLAGPDQPLLTAAEFADRHGSDLVELVKGVVVELPPGYFVHGRQCCLIGVAIFNWVTTHDLGTATSNNSWVRTGSNPDSVRGPDICYFSYNRIPRGPIPHGLLDAVPDLVVEVLSEEEPRAPMRAKISEYLAAGITAVIVVYPESESVTVYRAAEDPQTFLLADTLTIPDVLPGFTFPVARLFG